MVGMERDAEGQSCFFRSFSPSVKYVFLWANVLGVPLLILAIPKVEVVVVVTKGEEVLSATFFLVKLYEFVGCPVLGLEKGQDILESEL